MSIGVDWLLKSASPYTVFRVEIEQLRTENASLSRSLNASVAELDEVIAENVRLRAALEQISVNYPDPSPAGMIARAALEKCCDAYNR